MRVRLREFLPYIVAMVIIFVFMLLGSYVYTRFVNNTLYDIVYDQVETLTKNQAINFSNVVTQDMNNYLVNSGEYQTVILDKEIVFSEGYNYFIAQKKVAEDDFEDSDTDKDVYYVYANMAGSNYIRIPLKSVTNHMIDNSNNRIFAIVSETGSLLDEENIKSGGNVSSIYDFLRNGGTKLEDVDRFKDALKKRNSCTVSTHYVSNDYYVGATFLANGLVEAPNNEFRPYEQISMYFVSFYTPGGFETRLRETENLTIIYRLVLGISFVAVFINLGLTVLRGNRLFSLRRNSASRRGIAIIRVNRHGRVKFYARGRDTFGIIVGDFDVFKPVDGKKFEQAMRTETRFTAGYKLEDDTDAYAEFVCIPNQGGYLLISTVVTDEYKRELQLRKLTEENPISHLPNRNALLKNFDNFKSSFFNKQVTLVKIKLVEFGTVSKTLGFVSGDMLLRESVKIIKDNLPEDGMLYQDSNDTLIVILSDTYANNDRRLEKFLKEFLHPIALNKSTIYVHLKMGSYELRNVLNKDFDITDALTKTNIALARAASQVATSIVKYDSNLEVYVKYHEEMERDMNYALEHDEFVMYYQPQYSLKRKKIEGFESLIRWDNDKYRKVSPQEYIELAEKNGDIVEIGRLINRQVFRAAKSFEPYGVHLSINVSPAQLMQSGFVDELLTEFKKNALKPGAICVEITETFLMENYQLIISKLNILKANGFSLHLDDFGTGYSSMLYLKELPIDTIKTDKEFIKNLASDDASRVIEAEIIKMAKSLHLQVISEGVETPIQVEYLEKFGADYIQGYIVSKAVPFNEAIEMVEKGVKIEKIKGGKE